MASDGMTHMGGVKSCVATGGSVTVILSGASTGFNVFVRRAMTKITYASKAGKLIGTMSNYGTDV